MSKRPSIPALVIGVFVAMTVLPGLCHAESQHMKIVDQFFFVLEEKKGGEAIDYAFGTSPLAAGQQSGIAQLKLQYAGVEPLIGDYIGYDVLVDEVVFDRYAYVLVLAAYEAQPLKLEFVLYKAKDKWSVLNFLFNTDISEDLKSMAVRQSGQAAVQTP